MRRERSKRELRCFCSRHPLLAIWGNDEHGKPYIHVKIYKQNRVYGEVVIYGGEVKITCRECLRWHRITFMGGVRLEETPPPAEANENAQPTLPQPRETDMVVT